MATVSSKLAPKHKQNIASMWETDTKESLKALFKLIKENTAAQAINSQAHEHTRWLAGQHVAIELLEKEFDKLQEWSQKH